MKMDMKMVKNKEADKNIKTKRRGKVERQIEEERGHTAETSNNWKGIGKITVTVFLSALCCILLFMATGCIKKSAIEQSCRESAEFFYEKELFPYVIEEQFNTRQDNYADAILVNIMYHISQEDLFSSLIRAAYYRPEMEDVNVSFWESMQETKEPNVEYFRYWHGSMVLLRPLFVFTGIEGTRIFLGTLLFLLTAWVAICLWKQKAKALSVCYLLGNVVIQTWMCGLCIEYITTFLVMNAVSLLSILFFTRRKSTKLLYERLYRLLAAAGVCTCFVDFLTTETVTVTLPLLLLLVLRYEKQELEEWKTEIIRLVKGGIAWGCGYAFMFVLKWLLSALVLGWDAFGSALASAGERINGTTYLGNTNLDEEASVMQRFFGALFHNQGMLFPFRKDLTMGTAMICFLGVIFVCFCIVYLFRTRNFSGKMIGLCCILGAVPYLRYSVLENHSYMHYFFTYRAQLVTVVALLYCTWEFGLKNIPFLRRGVK